MGRLIMLALEYNMKINSKKTKVLTVISRSPREKLLVVTSSDIGEWYKTGTS